MSHNQAYINRSFASLHNEIDFLHDSGVLSKPLYDHLLVNLPLKYEGGVLELKNTTSSSQTELAKPGLSQTPSSQAMTSPPPYNPGSSADKDRVEAMYQYNGNGPTDLPLHPGQIVLVLEKMNPDWWRGKDVANGREGIFPSNYVRTVPSGPNDSKKETTPYVNNEYNSGYPSANNHNNGSNTSMYSNNLGAYGGHNQGYNNMPSAQSPSPFPPASTNYYPQQQPQQAQQPEQHAQPEQRPHHLPDGFKRFGNKLGNAAIFGAGSTIGSDIVNKIF
ncbi:SH3-domain-containing protein [Nadsonia fulvescens var. elongata DSM 6958]|uniref:SH3-domain-containing protein n=1 Tax=Nadsonia fulvescens var. elongata DSM 6958 TaxID=857566 RepID=A0A1E3PQ92_9ASCO|nr:SH3-domain-containing protein [Nadsonia fulvescens var. elongata DSM 6958]